MGGTVFLTFGLCFLFLTAPESPRLRSYLAARRAMACAYLFPAGCNVAEYLSRSPGDNIRLTQIITLVIGCSQAFLFTGIFIALINPQFLSGKKIMRQAGLFLLFVTALFGVYFLCPAERFRLLLAVYALLYAFLLIRFTRMFLANYRRYTLRMDNFYSGGEARHLKWVCVSFFAALAIGVAALLNALFMSAWGALAFPAVVNVFYAVLAIRFLNYPFAFRYLKQAMDDAPAGEPLLPPPESRPQTTALNAASNSGWPKSASPKKASPSTRRPPASAPIATTSPGTSIP
jgi:hypothetical protein